MIDNSVECLKQSKVDGFGNLRILKSKRQAPNLKKILTKAEFSQKQAGVFKCPDKICECCARHISKAHFSCDSSNLFNIVICPTCGEEYTGETGVGKTKLRDCACVHQ